MKFGGSDGKYLLWGQRHTLSFRRQLCGCNVATFLHKDKQILKIVPNNFYNCDSDANFRRESQAVNLIRSCSLYVPPVGGDILVLFLTAPWPMEMPALVYAKLMKASSPVQFPSASSYK